MVTAIIMFPGATPWNVADLDRDEKTPVRVWNADKGEFLDAGKPVAAVDRLTVFGVTPELNRPTVMGASNHLDLLISDLTSLSWDETTGLLKGQFAGANRKSATAYVHVPDGWSLKSGSVGKSKISASKSNASIVEIPG